jgi:hypothetical protein
MSKKLINEATRMQQLAGLLKENETLGLHWEDLEMAIKDTIQAEGGKANAARVAGQIKNMVDAIAARGSLSDPELNEDAEEDDDTEEDKPEIRRDAPDASLDVTDTEDLEKKVTAAQIGREDKGIKSMRSAAEKLAFYKGQKDVLFGQFKSGGLGKDAYVKQVMPIQTQIKQLEKTINKPLMGTDGDEEI